MTGWDQSSRHREECLAFLDIQIRKIEECGKRNNYVNFPNRTLTLFKFVKKVASGSTIYEKYEESTEAVWREWRRDENWAAFYKDPEKAKKLAYTLYQQAAYSKDNGREGGVIAQFSKRGDYQPNVSRFNEMLLEHFRLALTDILSTASQIPETEIMEATRENAPKIFIVHGHDESVELELKNYLQNTLKLGEPVVLSEKPSLGKTVIEKFEYYAEDVDIAFILATPDDAVVNEDNSEEERRLARQNVIFELGYFYASLRRLSGNVILLYKKPLELPSDLSGVVYIDISDSVASAGEDIRRELKKWL